MAMCGSIRNKLIKIGVISDPPPTPVIPTQKPTKTPAKINSTGPNMTYLPDIKKQAYLMPVFCVFSVNRIWHYGVLLVVWVSPRPFKICTATNCAWRAASIDPANTRADSCGLWKPVLFSDEIKSQRIEAKRCNS